MKKDAVDYSLYLVTDSTAAILGERDLCEVVAHALDGGVTVVQYRDKTSDTAVMIDTACRLHKITRGYGVPLLVNDRIDVALAVGCEGVHIGQDDMEISSARRILGPDAIIGVTASTADEALNACTDGADYLGIGTVFATPTKTDTKNVIGTAGLQQILDRLSQSPQARGVPAVCIGGINASNVQRVLFQSGAPRKSLSGIAIVSAVVAAADPAAESRRLLELVRSPPPFRRAVVERGAGRATDTADILAAVPGVIKAVHDAKPLSHNMTNLVVQNFAANVALAAGASPIMSNYGEEAADLSKLGGALVVNMGTVTPEGLQNYVKALKAYNSAGGPVIFDPVGAGATAVRRSALKTIMAAGYLDIIKGNEGEINTVIGDTATQQRGVDSDSTLDAAQRAALVRDLARREKNVVVMTGRSDFVSDGERTLRVDHGHELLGGVTGTGCCLGTTISAMAAASPGDKLVAAVAGLLLFEIAAERAAARDEVRGPGTFVPCFIDEIYRLRTAAAGGDVSWLKDPRVESVVL